MTERLRVVSKYRLPSGNTGEAPEGLGLAMASLLQSLVIEIASLEQSNMLSLLLIAQEGTLDLSPSQSATSSLSSTLLELVNLKRAQRDALQRELQSFYGLAFVPEREDPEHDPLLS
jgi:hypothetical protein